MTYIKISIQVQHTQGESRQSELTHQAVNMNISPTSVTALFLCLACRICITSQKEWPQVASSLPLLSNGQLREDGSNRNYTVAFVPLFSLIANFLPRIFNRFGSQLPTSVQQARLFVSHKERENLVKCLGASDVGSRWPDPDSRFHFYQCYQNNPLCPSEDSEQCYKLVRLQCSTQMVFHSQLLQCLPEFVANS